MQECVYCSVSVCVEIQESKEEQAESRRARERQEGESEFTDSLNIIEWDIVSTMLSSGAQTYASLWLNYRIVSH